MSASKKGSSNTSQGMSLSSVEDFNKGIERAIESELISIKRRALELNRSLTNPQPKQWSEFAIDAKRQVIQNSHMLYNYNEEDDLTTLKYLLMNLYNIFIGLEKPQNIFN